MNTGIPPHDPSLPPLVPPPSQSRTEQSSTDLQPSSFPTRSQTALPYQFPLLEPKPSLSGHTHDRNDGASSIPPPNASTGTSTSSNQRDGNTKRRSSHSVSSRMVSCPPCKKSHLKCGRGTRPCNQCIKRERVQDCLEGVPPEQAQLFLKAYHENAQSMKEAAFRVSRSQPVTPMFDNTPFFPSAGGPPYPRRFATFPPMSHPGPALPYPPLGQLDSSMASAPVMFILGQDLRIGRASQASLRTLGYHPHEMVNHTMAYYMPIQERDKWTNFTSKLFTTFTPAGRPLPVSIVELAKLNMNDLVVPVENVRSIAGHYHLRHHHKEPVLVRIELYFGSYFGATASDFNTFDKAIIVAKVTQPGSSTALPPTPIHNPVLPPVAAPSGRAVFPSVLMPPPPPPGSSLDEAKPPTRRGPRAPSVENGATLPPLRRLPSLSAALGGQLPPLPSGFEFASGSKLPPLGSMESISTFPGSMTTRKRRPSSPSPQDFGSLTLPPLHSYPGSDLPRPPSTRPRLESLSREFHNFSDNHYGASHQGSSLNFLPSFEGGLPPISRPQSGNRRPSYY